MVNIFIADYHITSRTNTLILICKAKRICELLQKADKKYTKQDNTILFNISTYCFQTTYLQ